MVGVGVEMVKCRWWTWGAESNEFGDRRGFAFRRRRHGGHDGTVVLGAAEGGGSGV